jgi:preprotein translocase subunit SecD
MYQFSTWKYWLVIGVLVIGTLFFLPNVFGLDEALQLSRSDRVAFDTANRDRVLGILKKDNVPVKADYYQKDRLVLRFESGELQAKANAAIKTEGNGDYVVALSKEPATPGWMRAIGLKPMSLGLDLRGGVNFVYQVDVQSAVTQAISTMERDARVTLREERIPYASSSVVTVGQDSDPAGQQVQVVLRDAKDLQDAVEVLKKKDSTVVIESRTTDAGPTLVMRLTPEQVKARKDQAIQQNITTLRRRVDELTVAEPIVTQQGANRISVQLPGVQDPAEAVRVLNATATLEFRLVDLNGDAHDAERTKRIPITAKLYHMREGGGPVLLRRDVIASGDQLTDASSTTVEGQPAVSVKLDSRAGAEMLRTTQENIGKPMAVVYIEKKHLAEGERCKGIRAGDDCTEEEVINVATIRGVFSTNFQITGLRATEAKDLAILLRSGALAANQYIVEQRTVGPSLGQDNIVKGERAMAIGLVLTFIFMAIYYRSFGWVANLVLLANLVLTVGLLSMLQASLSLPGIAAVVFHLGIAVDANILIYERIREELRMGNSPNAAINAGFEKAFATIADSNVTTLIAGVVLFAFGSGTIRSFAIVMTLGIITSLFTSVVGSRALVHAVWGRKRRLEKLNI